MSDILILAGILVLMIGGIYSGRKHFKGEGGCCGGSASEPREHKRLKQVMAKKTVRIEGMTCEHCRNRVERAVNRIDGAAARVNLKKKQAVISMERMVSDEEIRTAIENAGYTVIEIR